MDGRRRWRLCLFPDVVERLEIPGALGRGPRGGRAFPGAGPSHHHVLHLLPQFATMHGGGGVNTYATSFLRLPQGLHDHLVHIRIPQGHATVHVVAHRSMAGEIFCPQ